MSVAASSPAQEVNALEIHMTFIETGWLINIVVRKPNIIYQTVLILSMVYALQEAPALL